MPIVTFSDGPSAQAGEGYCDFCRQAKDTLSPEPPELFIVTVEELETGAKMGCKTCYFRCRAISTFYTSSETQVEFSRLRYFTFDNHVFYEIFKMPGTEDAEFAMISERSVLPGNTGSEQTFWTIESWVQECLSEHEVCGIRSRSPYFPKRVLDVSNGQLVLREELDEAYYACLSHCWGPSQSPIRTLTTTIDDFKKNIPWSSLSKTFQDAVDICRRLHIDYVWIDSLCIIQDSDEDWSTESMKMASIYENAYLTIAATKSTDGAGGCYSSTDPESVFCRPIVENLVYCSKRPPEFNMFNRQRDWPLLTRAWVYQEMRLSPIVLHFGSEEIIWQCRHGRRSESRSNDSDAPTTLTYNDRYLSESDLFSWYNTVYEYSHLSLTFEKDRFAALAAVAQREATTRGLDGEFLLGLWKDKLLHDLLWQIVPHQQLRRRIMSRVTWPWLGRNRALRLLDCTSLIYTDIQYTGSPYLGRYEKAILHLRGPLIATTLAEIGHDGIRGLSDGQSQFILGDIRFLPIHQTDVDIYADSGPIVDSNREVYFLPIAIMTDVIFSLLGLVLIRSQTESSPEFEYERIGSISMQAIEDSSNVPPRPMPEARFEAASTRLISHLSNLKSAHIKLV
ncbi:HET-domain-containing protein [Hypomontagnella submonticulosa]|nr:HET-domain-containing protein [Hypomontagnella submonticulosa]